METASSTAIRRPELVPSSPATETSRALSVTAVCHLSEAGRKASLLQGGDGRTVQRLDVSVAANRLHLVTVNARGEARLKLSPRFEVDDSQRVRRIDEPPAYDAPPTVDQLFKDAARNHELERAYRAERSAWRAKRRESERDWRREVAAAFLADETQRAMVHPSPSPTRCVIVTSRGRVRFDAHDDEVPARDRTFPMTVELRALLAGQRTYTDEVQRRTDVVCPHVFHRDGRPIKSFRAVFRTACIAAGCPGRLLHDLLRTAVRNLVRAGIPERVAMQMTGHKTRCVFERYNIVSEGDLREAARRLDAQRR